MHTNPHKGQSKRKCPYDIIRNVQYIIHEENIQNPWTEIENKTPRKPKKPFEKKLLGLLTQERRKTPNMMIVILSDNPVQ